MILAARPRVLLGASAPGNGLPRPARRRSAVLPGRLDGDDAARGGLPDRAGSGGAGHPEPGRDGLRRAGTPVRRGDARLSARHHPHGPGQAARGYRRRRALRDQPRLRRRPGAPDGCDAVEEGRPGDGAARSPLLRGHERRRARRCPDRLDHRLRGHQPAAHGERSGVRPRQLDPPGARGADAGGDLQGRVRRSRYAAALAGPSATTGGHRRAARRAAAPGCRAPRGDVGHVAVRPWLRCVGPLFHHRERRPCAARGHARRVARPQPRPAARIGDGAHSGPRRDRAGLSHHEAAELRAADRRGRVHVRVRDHPVHGRRVPGCGGHVALRRRAGTQPRAPRRAGAGGRHVRREAGRAGTRVPGGGRRLVPPGVSLRRP